MLVILSSVNSLKDNPFEDESFFEKCFANTGISSILSFKVGIFIGTTFNLWEDVNNTDITDEMDHMPVLELGANYAINEAWEFDASMNYDLEERERSDIKLVATFSF